MDLCWQNNVSFLNMLSRLIIAFLPRSKRLLISWLQSPSAMILEPKKIVSHCFHCFSIYCPWSMGPDDMILLLCVFSFKGTFSLSSFTFIKGFFSSSLSAVRAVSSAYLVIDISASNLESRLCFQIYCASRIILNKSGKSRHPCLFPDLNGKASTLLLLSC